MEARSSSNVGQYGASNRRGSQSSPARPQTAGRAREQKGREEGKVRNRVESGDYCCMKDNEVDEF